MVSSRRSHFYLIAGLAALFVLICVLLQYAQFSYAAEPELSGTMRTWRRDYLYQFTGEIRDPGNSTASAPNRMRSSCNTVTYYYPNQVYMRINGTYSGLKPNTAYQGKLTVYIPGRSNTVELDVGEVTTGDSEEGAFTVEGHFENPFGVVGKYHVELDLRSGDDLVSLGKDHTDNRYAFIIGGFDTIHGSRVSVSDNQSAFNPNLNLVIEDDVANGITVSHKFKMVGLRPNTSYYYWDELRDYTNGAVIDNKSGSFTTDEDGNAVIDYVMGTYDVFKAGKYYQVWTRVQRAGTAVFTDYDYEHDINRSNVFIVCIDNNEPEEETTFVDLTVKKINKEDNAALAGAKLKIVDSRTGETVKEWTSRDSEEHITLPVGKYKLIEDKAPEGFKKAGDTDFELTADKALVRGHAFSAYTDYVTIKNDYNFYEMFYHRFGETENAELGYCINTGMYDPSPLDHFEIKRLFYKEKLVESTELLDAVTNKDLSAEDLNDHIKRVIYNGYPTDASGIKEKYDLNDEEFRFVTQMAVHHYTDNKDWDEIDLGRERNYIEAYRELCRCETSAPDDMILRVYIAENPDFQSLVAAEFKSRLGLDLVLPNEKIEDEPEKEEEQASPKLTVKKTSKVKEASPGDVVPFRIEIRNTGDAEAKGVRIIDTLGDELDYVRDDFDGEHSEKTVEWETDIAAGEKKEILIHCRIKEDATSEVINNVRIVHESISGTSEEHADKALIGLKDEEEAKSKEVTDGEEDKGISDVKTGDEKDPAIWTLLLIMSVLALVIYKIKTRNDRE